MAAPYLFNPSPEFSDRTRRDGAGIVNAGRFAVVAGSGGNAVLVRPQHPASDAGGYRATACPAACQCQEFQERAACPHVLAAMIVRAGYEGGSIVGGKAARRRARGAQPARQRRRRRRRTGCGV